MISAKQTIADFCQDNTLVIPRALHDMADAHAVISHGQAGIFHKLIRRDMTGIEFYATQPLLAFVLAGEEHFTAFDNREVVLREGEMLFIPRDTHMVSDFVNRQGPLEAFLFFFDHATIEEFLRQAPAGTPPAQAGTQPFLVKASAPVSGYMSNLHTVYRDISGTENLLRTKLLELLFLLDALDEREALRGFLTNIHGHKGRRSIRHLMADHRLLNLNIQDFATISGRSPATFNRDFKRQFGETPRRWLIAARLERARSLLAESELNVTQIALEVGYENTSHFIKAFRTRFGQTPKQARLEITD